MDKEALSQALDLIHNDASQSETLTTFNEYTSPPTSSSLDGKSITSELQGGLSGLYNRLRASVGGVSQKVEGNETNDDEDGVGNLPLRNPRPPPSTSTPTAKQLSISLRSHSPSVSSVSILDVEAPTSRLHSPLNVTAYDAHIHDHDGPDKAAKSSSAQQSGAPRSSTSSASLLKSNSSSLKQMTQPVAVSPTLAEVSVSTVRDTGRSSNFFSDSQVKNGNTNRLNVKIHKETTWPTAPTATEVNFDGFPSINSVDDNHNDDINNTQGSQPPSSALPVVADDTARVHFVRRPHEEKNDLASAELARTMTPRADSEQLDQESSRKASVQSQVHRSYPPELNPSRASSEGLSQDAREMDIPRSKVHREHEIADSHVAQPSSHSRIAELVRVDADPRALNVAMSQIKSRVLSKEYWMRDENAKDCFYCGDPFSTFRRKHHCRKLLCHRVSFIIIQIH